jgi:molybdopterin-containing oxidoreductase family iron-sulfur binding subunit
MGASMALAGLSGCRRGDERILPYAVKPAEITPGVPLYYATTLTLGASAVGVLAETHEGRPTKLEGNPRHPASGGALSALGQASILELYDPDRSGQVLDRGIRADWEEEFLPALEQCLAAARQDRGASLAIVTRENPSPARQMLFDRLRETLPKAGIYSYEPLDFNGGRRRSEVATEPDLEGAQVILSLDWDGLGLEDDGTRHQRAWSRGRGGEPGQPMNRLYVVEPHWTVTGMAADHRLRLKGSQVRDYALALAATLDPGPFTELAPTLEDIEPQWVVEVARDLKAANGRCVVVAGRRQPPDVHALVRHLNNLLGSQVRYTRASNREGNLFDLMSHPGHVKTLIILDANPVLDAPADLRLESLMRSAETRIHMGLYYDETAAECHWHLPAAHPLERWEDALSRTMLSPVQPLVEPLLDGRSPLELLARVAGYRTSDPYEIVRDSFRGLTGSQDLEARWQRYLHEGAAEVSLERVDAPVYSLSEVVAECKAALSNAKRGEYELCFSADASVYDGRFANNGWLQETPDPVTKLVWDNAAIMSPATAGKLGVTNGDYLSLIVQPAGLDLPAFVVPGTADGVIQLPLGYGRRRSGRLGRHAGFDVYPLRRADAPSFQPKATVSKLRSDGYSLATTQEHWSIESHAIVDQALHDRAIVREGTREEYDRKPDFAHHMGMHTPPSVDIYERPEFTGEHQWGMAIDLSRCTGCNACSVACQSENNIPLVGKDEVRRGREMAWMRIDRYFRGADPRGEVTVANQPMLCQHCESAPCEPVCPVNATVHDNDGLNVMVYNRCIGTRYCSNNCPYKVRRFNFYDYNKGTLRADDAPFDGDWGPDPRRGLSQPQGFQPAIEELEKLQKNPDVTVRMRGVMEKCTFCVQRIQGAKIERKVDAGQTPADKVADGTLRTACQQSCPTEAIVFGDLSDPESRVSRLKRLQRNYAVLKHLNTRPRTTYLARIRNSNPAMPVAEAHTEEAHG